MLLLSGSAMAARTGVLFSTATILFIKAFKAKDEWRSDADATVLRREYLSWLGSWDLACSLANAWGGALEYTAPSKTFMAGTLRI
jgi:hypothetical protein